MKKNLLFIMNNLSCGGAEKALISLLQTIDYSLYNVDLLLFKKEGVFLNQVPKDVKILDEPKNYHYFDMSLKKAILKNLYNANFKVILFRILAGVIFKTERTAVIREQKIWRFLKQVIPSIPKNYDVAIGYLENTPNYFCVDKVNAKMKIGFIHNDYNQLQMNSNFDLPYFEKLNKVITVSEDCKSILENRFPTLKNKFEIIYNTISSQNINELASTPIDFQPKGISLISIGRLNTQKGYDLAIKACKILVDNKIDVYWYVLGDGEEKENLEKLIIENNLSERFIFLGIKENPYPYLKKANIFVHTARFEGFGIVITEAKILNKPMVITNFNVAKLHINNLQNGLIADLTPQSIAEKLELLINDKNLMIKFSSKLKEEINGDLNEINKFYNLLENNKNHNNIL